MTSDPRTTPILLDLPFRGRWLTQNSPARRIPSHGTTLFGTSHAIDFVPVDEHGRSARLSLRSWLRPEPPELFVGFGAPVLAPVAGRVVAVHDGEVDHEARRTLLPQIPYALTQAGRARQGWGALAGNFVAIAMGAEGPFVALAHLQRGSLQVAVGQQVAVGDVVGACGNSGNSTEPHLHLQVNDSTDWAAAQGLPIAFRGPDGPFLPAEREIVVG